jgi:hypothetical protein
MKSFVMRSVGGTSTEDRIWRRLAMVWIDHLYGVHESGKRVDDRRRVAPCPTIKRLAQRSKRSQVERYLTLSLSSLAACLSEGCECRFSLSIGPAERPARALVLGVDHRRGGQKEGAEEEKRMSSCHRHCFERFVIVSCCGRGRERSHDGRERTTEARSEMTTDLT